MIVTFIQLLQLQQSSVLDFNVILDYLHRFDKKTSISMKVLSFLLLVLSEYIFLYSGRLLDRGAYKKSSILSQVKVSKLIKQKTYVQTLECRQSLDVVIVQHITSFVKYSNKRPLVL